jgi:hypothetical protein
VHTGRYHLVVSAFVEQEQGVRSHFGIFGAKPQGSIGARYYRLAILFILVIFFLLPNEIGQTID